MTRRRLPIGIQDFRRLRETGSYYVDKTPLIRDLVEQGDYYFLSRPRRFGKSLLLDTLGSLFACHEPLFRVPGGGGASLVCQLWAHFRLFISCGQCRGVIWADVVIGWCVVCTDHGRPRALEAAGFEQGVEGDCPPTMRQRMPERFMRCVTRVLFAASTSRSRLLVASARGSACDGDACGRRPVRCRCRLGPLARQCREGGAAPGSPCRCRGGRDAGSRGTSRTSGAPLHGWPPRADARRHTSVLGSRPLRKVQLSAAASATALIPISGRHRLICSTSFASCAFSVCFRPSGMRPR